MWKGPALELARRTGIQIAREGEVIAWAGAFGGNVKPQGPLAGKKIGVIVASEFSDFQAYYLVSYIGEFGGKCEFLLVDWVTWKFVRPNIANKGVRGMWDLSVDPIPVMGGDKPSLYRSLRGAAVEDYDALVVIGGHSADVMLTEAPVIDFIRAAYKRGAAVGAIAGGVMPLISAGIMAGKSCTGDRTVDYMLKKIARFESVPVRGRRQPGHRAGPRWTPPPSCARYAAYSAPALRPLEGRLGGKRVMLLVGEDFEDIELVVPVMELLYRGAEVLIGQFPSRAQIPATAPRSGCRSATSVYRFPFRRSRTASTPSRR